MGLCCKVKMFTDILAKVSKTSNIKWFSANYYVLRYRRECARKVFSMTLVMSSVPTKRLMKHLAPVELLRFAQRMELVSRVCQPFLWFEQ